MNFEVEDGIVKMQGFNISKKILISDADEVSIKDENGKFIEVEPIEVIIEVETLETWINEWGLLDDLGIEIW